MNRTYLARRILSTLLPALLGGALGYFYAFFVLEYPEASSWPAIYGAAGAAVFVLGFRLAQLLRAMWKEFRRPEGGEGGDAPQ